MKTWKNSIRFSLLVAVAVAIVVVVSALNHANDAVREAKQILQRSAIARCQSSALSAANDLNIDFYIYRADYASGKDKTLAPKERRNRTDEARKLFEQASDRASRVDVAILKLPMSDPNHLMDPNIRKVVKQANFKCSSVVIDPPKQPLK